MRKVLLTFVILFFSLANTLAANEFDFAVGEVIDVNENGALVELANGEKISVEQNSEFATTANQIPSVGKKFVLGRFEMEDEKIWQFYDRYRLPALGGVLAIFLAAILLVGGIRGASALLGLAVSIACLFLGVIPAIAGGAPPLLVALIGGSVIAGATIFLAHGFNFRSLLAFVATLVALFFAALVAALFTNLTALFGTGSEESFYLTNGVFQNLDLRGLLLAGILLGALGVLDDITVASVTIVDELKKANPHLSRGELFRRSLRVGREHIASMVNTLALAYAGVALPLLLLFYADANQPLWAFVNSEFAAEEIVRTLVGSLALVFAAPLACGLGAIFLRGEKNELRVNKEN